MSKTMCNHTHFECDPDNDFVGQCIKCGLRMSKMTWEAIQQPVKKDDLPGGSTPSQYAIPEDAKELQDLIEYRGMNFAVGNIFKACYRLGIKDGVPVDYDLRKIIYFAERELARVQKNK